jgi:hypothetical protein
VCDADSQDNFAGLKFLAILEFDLEAAPGCEVNLSYPFLFQIGDALLLEGEAIGAERLQPNGAPGITIRFPGLLAKTFQRVGLVGVT